ncbi:MAG: MarR family transcriptional regulator, partial [Erysipelothrix sp.]|nr:MarR family transcriptional regulator [Erysipelothrix sp.]
MKLDARQVLNELLVDIFNRILIIEERYHRLHGVKLTMSEIHTLEGIQKSETKRMSDVASDLRITQGTLTVTINRLSHKGYVNRTQDTSDRRIYRLGLTEKGSEVMDIHNQFHEEMVDRLMLHIDDDSAFIESLAQINVF